MTLTEALKQAFQTGCHVRPIGISTWHLEIRPTGMKREPCVFMVASNRRCDNVELGLPVAIKYLLADWETFGQVKNVSLIEALG